MIIAPLSLLFDSLVLARIMLEIGMAESVLEAFEVRALVEAEEMVKAES